MTRAGNDIRIPIRGHRAQWGLLACWALLWGASYPPLNLYPLAYFALLPLTLLAVRGAPLGRIALYAWLAGFAWWLVMIYWMTFVTRWGYVGCSAVCAVYPVAFLLIVRLVHRILGAPLILLVPTVWIATEFVRSRFGGGFPWFQMGHSQPTIMIQIADLAGSYGVSFVVAMTSGALADLLTRPIIRRGDENRPARWGLAVKLALPLWLLATAGTIGYGTYRLGQSDGRTGPAVRVGVVQTNVPQSLKNNPTDETDRAMFDQLIALSERTLDGRPDLIVWPETMVPDPLNEEALAYFRAVRGPWARRAAYRERIADWVDRRGVPIAAGAGTAIMEPQPTPRGRRWVMTDRYNSVYVFMPRRGLVGRYDKIHRVPFGEYLPLVEGIGWAETFLSWFTPEGYTYQYTLTRGTDYARFRLDGPGDKPWRFAATICYEDVVTYVPRGLVYEGGKKRADLLVNLTNDGWYPGTTQGPQHEQIARFRCVENRVPMARAVNTGYSGYIDSTGRIIKRVRVEGRLQEVAGAAVASMRRDPRTTFFGSFGYHFVHFAGWATLALIVLALSRKLRFRKRT